MFFVKRVSLVFASSILLLFNSTGAFAQEGDTEVSTANLVERTRDAVALIRVQGERGTSLGSGFVVDPEGLILTNQHVIENATGIRIELPSGEVFERAQVLDTDPRRDLALLRVPGFGLPHLELGNSDSLRVGNRTIAIGSPLGFENTVSTGILSGRRELDGYQLLQISAPISSGSSGGPVFGPDGRVVGVAVAQIEEGQNLNFAVPINYVRGMLNFISEEPQSLLSGPFPTDSLSPDGQTGTRAVNEWLKVKPSDVVPFTIRLREETDNDITWEYTYRYRLIEAAGEASAILERFVEFQATRDGNTLNETTLRSEARVPGLTPMSTHMDSRYMTNEGPQRRAIDIEFEGGIARGRIEDTRKGDQQVSRELPTGTIDRELLPAAIMFMQGDSLQGTSRTIAAYNSRNDSPVDVRISFERIELVDVNGERIPAYRTVISSGAKQDVVYYRVKRPRVLVGYGEDSDMEVEEIEGIKLDASTGN